MTTTSRKQAASPPAAPPQRDDRGQQAVLVLAGTLTIMAGATVAPAIPGIRAAFSHTPDVDLLARMITTTHALAIVVCAPLAGMLGQRIGRKRALLLGMAAFALGGSSGSFLPNLPAILAGRVVLGFGVALVMANSAAMVADLYRGTDRQRLLGRQTAAGAFGGVVLLVGSGALAGIGWRNVFLIYLFGALLILPTLRYLPGGRPDEAARAPRGARKAGPGDRAEGADPGARPARRGLPRMLLAALAAMTLCQVFFYAVPVQVPFLVQDHFKFGSVVSGAVIAVQTLVTGVVSMRFPFFRRLAGERALVALSFLGISAGYLVLYLAPGVAVLAVGLVVMGTGLGILMPNLNTWVLDNASVEERGRYAGYLTTALFLGQFLAPLATQPVVDTLGIQPTFGVIAGAALVVAAGYALTALRAGRAAEGR